METNNKTIAAIDERAKTVDPVQSAMGKPRVVFALLSPSMRNLGLDS